MEKCVWGVKEVALYVKGGLKRSLSIGNFIGIYAYEKDIRITYP